MSKLFSSFFVAVYAAGFFTLAATWHTESHACSPMPPGVHGSTPGSYDETAVNLPANSAMIFSAKGVPAENFSATLDGATVDLEVDTVLLEKLNFGSSYQLPLRLADTPAVGQEIVVKGCWEVSMWGEGCSTDNCADGCIDETVCNYCNAYTFNVVAEDDAVPTAPISWSFSMHDYPDVPANGASCQGESSLAYYLDLFRLVPETDMAAPNYISMKAYLAEGGNPDEPILKQVQSIYGTTAQASFRTSHATINHLAPDTSICFQVQTFDAANNASDTSTLCTPCYTLSTPDPEICDQGPGPGSGMFMNAPQEPKWAEAHLHSGGHCSSEIPCDYVTCESDETCHTTNQTVWNQYNACLDACDLLGCPDNTHCVAGESATLTIQDNCIEDTYPACDKECPACSHCELVTVNCINSPCPPIDTCVADFVDSDAGIPETGSEDDAGPTTEPEPEADAGTTTEPEPEADAGTTAEPQTETDAGNPALEFAPTSDGEVTNCECAAAPPSRGGFSGLTLFGLAVFVLRRRQKL